MKALISNFSSKYNSGTKSYNINGTKDINKYDGPQVVVTYHHLKISEDNGKEILFPYDFIIDYSLIKTKIFIRPHKRNLDTVLTCYTIDEINNVAKVIKADISNVLRDEVI